MARRGHGKKLSYYQQGMTAIFASQKDQRFSYGCYLPESYDEDGTTDYPLTVLVHGSTRNVDMLRHQFRDFAETHQTIVLAPLFPCGIVIPGDMHNYKRILFEDIRYDLILLSMIEEISALYRIRGDKFLLHGFSGGGQFAHRFLYLHPERLAGVSIGAPGIVTLLDDSKPWWVGTGGMEELFGHAPDIDAMRRVPVQMVIGGDDVETWDIIVAENSSSWMEGVNDSGANRIERLRRLESNFLEHGIAVRFDVVPGVMHVGSQMHPMVQSFFSGLLTGSGRS
jgi:pimeloyl-ACP methyl ester carboxylesterase